MPVPQLVSPSLPDLVHRTGARPIRVPRAVLAHSCIVVWRATIGLVDGSVAAVAGGHEGLQLHGLPVTWQMGRPCLPADRGR